MSEQKIKFKVLEIKYEDKLNNISRAIVKIKEKITDIIYEYTELNVGKEYEALTMEDTIQNGFKVRRIAEVCSIDTFVKEVLAGDKKVSEKDRINIAERFCEQPLRTIIDDKELMNVMGEGKAKYISGKAERYMELAEIQTYCMTNGITRLIVEQIYNKLGVNAIEVIRNNPYTLYQFEVNYTIIDRLGHSLEIPYSNKERLKCGVLEYLKHRSDKHGHVFVPRGELIENVSSFISKHGGYPGKHMFNEKQINEVIEDLVAEEKIVVYINATNESCIYLKELYNYETGIADIVSQMLFDKIHISKGVMTKANEFISSYADGDFKLTKEQGNAVRNVITEKISLLSGLPGTGKTKTLRAIVECIKKIFKDVKIEVVAFTGRATSRLNEILPQDIQAKTIHRLLGIGKNGKATAKEIDCDFLIIDESTLVSMELAYLLLRHISKDTRVLFVGDKNQITMGVGQVFADLLSCNQIKSVQLNEIFRQKDKSTILKNIHKMAKGCGFDDKNGLKCKKGEFEFVEVIKESEIEKKIEEIIAGLVKSGKSIRDIQVLSPIKEGKGGTKKLNKIIQERFNPNPKRLLYNLVVGDRVMQNINGYSGERNIFNGEIGLVIGNKDIESKRKVTVAFGKDKIIEYNGGEMSEIEPAYAMTIHKSQGSEFPVVIMPILKEHRLDLNLLYTGVSRAESKVFLIGDIEAFNKAVKRKLLNKNSNLRELINIDTNEELGKAV